MATTKKPKQLAAGTTVLVLGDHAPDAPPAIGIIIGPIGDGSRRALVRMGYGQTPAEWGVELSQLEAVTDADVTRIEAECKAGLAAYKAAEAENEAAEVAHVREMAQLRRDAEQAEMQARIQRSQEAAAEGARVDALEQLRRDVEEAELRVRMARAQADLAKG